MDQGRIPKEMRPLLSEDNPTNSPGDNFLRLLFHVFVSFIAFFCDGYWKSHILMFYNLRKRYEFAFKRVIIKNLVCYIYITTVLSNFRKHSSVILRHFFCFHARTSVGVETEKSCVSLTIKVTTFKMRFVLTDV